MKLRPYQEELVAKVRHSMASGNKRVAMQSPTGSGKTVTFAHIVSNAISKGKKVLVIAHREELILQAHKTLWTDGIKAGVIMANYDESSASVQIASVQTLVKRLDRNYPDFDLIVCDECHHSTASTYGKIFDRWEDAYILGVTATPCRIDGNGLGDLFTDLVHGPQIADLIEQGSLVKPVYVTTNEIDLTGVKITAGDYNKKQLIAAVRRSQVNGDLVKHWQREAYGLQTIVFAVSIEHSLEIVQAYQDAGINAEHIDGGTSKELRPQIIDRFAKREITVLSNVGIFTEGFDVPSISCVQLARPTKSVSLYYQMVGRALRPSEGKTEAIVLDHAGLYHDLGDVSMPKYWELEPKRNKKKNKEQDLISKGEREERVINFDGSVQLVRIGELDTDWILHLRELLSQLIANQYKKVWLYHTFLNRYPLPTINQMKAIGKALGYHYLWAQRQFDALAKSEKAA